MAHQQCDSFFFYGDKHLFSSPDFCRKMLPRLWWKGGRQRRIFQRHFRKRTAVSRFDVNVPSQSVVACLRGSRVANRGKQPKVERQRRGLLLEAGGAVMMSSLDTFSWGEWLWQKMTPLTWSANKSGNTKYFSVVASNTLSPSIIPTRLGLYHCVSYRVGEMDFANKECEIEF